MATINEKIPPKVVILFEDKGIEEDEVVFRFERSTEENECYMSLSEYNYYGEQKELNELYVSKAFLCIVSPVFKAMFSPDSKFEESQDVVRICDFPRMSYLALFRMIHPTTYQQPSGNRPLHTVEHRQILPFYIF